MCEDHFMLPHNRVLLNEQCSSPASDALCCREVALWPLPLQALSVAVCDT